MQSDYEELNDEYPRLYRRHREMVWRMCERYAGHDLDLARDLAQDVYIALWLDYEALRARGNLKVERAWVWWHTRTILSHHSRRRRLAPLPGGYDNADSERQQREEMLEHLQHLTAHLLPAEQEVVRLYLEGYSHAEIGTMTGRSTAAAKQMMHRAMQKMKQLNEQTQ